MNRVTSVSFVSERLPQNLIKSNKVKTIHTFLLFKRCRAYKAALARSADSKGFIYVRGTKSTQELCLIEVFFTREEK